MNKKMIIGLTVAVVVVVVGAAVFFLLRSQNGITLAHNALTGKGEATCTLDSANVDGATDTMYAKDGVVRFALTKERNGRTAKDNFLQKDNTSYAWTDGDDEGIIIPNFQGGGTDDETDLKDWDKEEFKKEYEKHNYSCKGSVDESRLKLPEDVEFTDLYSDFNE